MPNKKNDNIQDEKLFTVFIESLTGTTFEIKVSPQDKIRSIKCKIQRVEGNEKYCLSLLFIRSISIELENTPCLPLLI